MTAGVLLAIDQGASSTKCLVVDRGGKVIARGQAPVSIATPQPGWVEQDTEEIWNSVRRALDTAMDAIAGRRVASIGLRRRARIGESNSGRSNVQAGRMTTGAVTAGLVPAIHVVGHTTGLFNALY